MKKEGQFAPELVVSIADGDGRPRRAEVEHELRQAIQRGSLHPGTALPSTRALARELGVSRGLVTEAYTQLASEGYLLTRQGAPTRVAQTMPVELDGDLVPEPLHPGAPYDLRAWVPDLAQFPRREWRRSLESAVRSARNQDLDYGAPHGVKPLRRTLAAYLGRARGVVAKPKRTVITTGTEHTLTLLGRALASAGVRSIAVEDPGPPIAQMALQRGGLSLSLVPVDAEGLRVDALARTRERAVVVTPSHQFPMGTRMSAARRTALVAWARERQAIVIEDDYDGEFRYDGPSMPALQGTAPECVVYLGTASKILAPGMRLGWAVIPDRIRHQLAAEMGATTEVSVFEQLAFADFIERGELDRHLRQARKTYRHRRECIVAALARDLPEARVGGVAAGLHLCVELSPTGSASALTDAARKRGVAVYALPLQGRGRRGPQIAVTIGYGNIVEESIGRAITELAAAYASLSSSASASASA